jgi:hypothetical protein
LHLAVEVAVREDYGEGVERLSGLRSLLSIDAQRRSDFSAGARCAPRSPPQQFALGNRALEILTAREQRSTGLAGQYAR